MKLFDFLKDLWEWIIEKFTKIDPILKEVGTIAVNVVEAVKKIIESPTAVFITDLIPGDVDDHIRELLISVIPHALATSTLVRDSADMTPDELLAAWLEQAAKLDHDTASAEYLSMASKIVKQLARDLADGELSITEATGLAYSIFNGFIKKKK